jgi:hypothetical protein
MRSPARVTPEENRWKNCGNYDPVISSVPTFEKIFAVISRNFSGVFSETGAVPAMRFCCPFVPFVANLLSQIAYGGIHAERQ